LGTKIGRERGQVSSLIEIHYAIGARSGASSSNPPRITDGDVVSSPIESSEVLPSLGDAALGSSVSNFEVVKRSRGSAESSHSSFTLIEADSEAPELELESPPPATPVLTEEEEFLANLSGDTDEFGVRLRCLYLPSYLWLIEALVPQISPIRCRRPQGKSQSRRVVCGNVRGSGRRSENDHQEIRWGERSCLEGTLVCLFLHLTRLID
jgi:hypothetical protein